MEKSAPAQWTLAAVVLAAAVLPAQKPGKPWESPADKAVRKRAMRLIRALELPDQRATAAPELLKLGAKAVPSLVRALDDPRPEVVARLALVVHAFGEAARPAVPTLRRMAKADDEALAFAARWALSRFEPMGATVIARTGGNGGVCVLNAKRDIRFTLDNSANSFHATRLPNGRFLVAILSKNVVHEIDRKGKVVWKHDKIRSPTSATRLVSGHTLICSNAQKAVIEIDPKGKEVWRHACNMPYFAERLNTGNTLIADYSAQAVIEVTPKREVVWSYKGLRGPLHAHRLDNGNTLITSHAQKAVHEVTPKGKVVLQMKLPSAGWSACRLPNGDTIAGGANFLVCYDKKGKQRWRKNGLGTITSVQHY